MIGAPRRTAGRLILLAALRDLFLEALSGLQALVSVDETYEGEIDPRWLEAVVEAGLAAADVAGPVEVSLLITGDETVRELNAEYRGLDETTDVLSFSADHQGHWEGEGDGPERQAADDWFVLPPGVPAPLGEIIVSLPQAQRQADERGGALSQELAHLVIHGALHLVGFDHVDPDETALMQAWERRALESLQLTESMQA